MVAAVPRIRDDPLQLSSDRLLEVRDHCCKRVPVIRVAGQRLHMSHELPALAAVERCRDTHLHAELVGLVRLTLADALHLRGMQTVDLAPSLPLPLILDPP